MDEQNHNEINEGADSVDTHNHEHVDEGQKKSGMLGTVAIIILVLLLGYGVYAYLNKSQAPVDTPTTDQGTTEVEGENGAEDPAANVDVNTDANVDVSNDATSAEEGAATEEGAQ